MSKMLLPTELDTAMSPCPFLATARLDSASGMLVPPARSVSPMIVSGILAVSPRTVHIQTMTYERAPIMEMHRKKVMGYHLARSSRAQSGMKKYMNKVSGMQTNHKTFPNIVSGTSHGSNGPSSSSSSSSSPPPPSPPSPSPPSPSPVFVSSTIFSSGPFSAPGSVPELDTSISSGTTLVPVALF